jgi:hypothetical protein
MEPEGSLQCYQEPALESDEPIPQPHSLFL